MHETSENDQIHEYSGKKWQFIRISKSRDIIQIP